MLALTRDVSSGITRCELTHLVREPIDLGRARRQHRVYEEALESLGCTVCRLPADDSMPDSVFIEDTAVVVPEIAIVARPGAESRRDEVHAVAEALRPLRRLVAVEPPGTLDGGDVMVAGATVFVGRSGRTNDAGIGQLRAALEPFGYRVIAVVPSGCLHLKSAVTALDDTTLLVNPGWLTRDAFAAFDCVEVDPHEPGAANVVAVRGQVLVAAAYPRTSARLAQRGFAVVPVDASELAKAEGALTCCSILVS